MIIGIGNDLCNIERIEKTLEKFGERFENRVFTETEIALARRRRRTAETYAKRFAAKEACAKALGTGFSAGVFWRDMEVVNLPSGQPALRLAGGAAARLADLLPAGHAARLHVSLTDDPPMAQAFVIIEALPVSVAG